MFTPQWQRPTEASLCWQICHKIGSTGLCQMVIAKVSKQVNKGLKCFNCTSVCEVSQMEEFQTWPQKLSCVLDISWQHSHREQERQWTHRLQAGFRCVFRETAAWPFPEESPQKMRVHHTLGERFVITYPTWMCPAQDGGLTSWSGDF